MKLLLADDEVITRKGLIENIDWESLQIHQILEAEDGVQALTLAKKYSPEIILTDIRMPRMDGVEFVEKVREFLPNTSIIFMSGYTDKEYLQAAIRMKAVYFVEKPIDNNEIITAIKEATRFHEMMVQNQYYSQLQQQEKSARLALSLTHALPARSESSEAKELIAELGLPFQKNTWFLTLLLKTFPPFLELGDPDLTILLEQLTRMVESKPFNFIYALKYDSVFVFHIYAQHIPDQTSLQDFYHYLTQQLTPEHSWFLAVGSFVQGPEHIYESYNKAAVLLQSSFFYNYNSILTEEKTPPVDSDFLENIISEFSEQISRKDTAAATKTEDKLFNRLKNCQTLLPSNAKDTYFKLFIALEQAYRMQMLFDEASSKPIWDRILACNTLFDLHSMLLDELKRLEKRAQESAKESSPVSMMKDYIYKNFFADTLSVKDISSHAGLSVSYACTLFKSETGTTLNQYLTGYRMEKAKQLLADPRIRISDISERVGYQDGNYFSKSFKKATGLTPSEYREKLLT